MERWKQFVVFTGTHITGDEKYYEVNLPPVQYLPSLCLDGGYSQLRGELLHLPDRPH